MGFPNLILILCIGILLQKGQGAYATPVDEVPSEAKKVLEYEISNTKPHGLITQDLKAQRSCNWLFSCKNKGQCVNGTCHCPQGTSGDYCGTIDSCNELDCETISATCAYGDNKQGAATCICNKLNHVYVNKQCIETCEKDTDCPEGEKCKVVEDGTSKSCRCPKGRSGDKCSIIDDCVSGTYRNCNDDKGTCKYDEEHERAYCVCEDDKKLDPSVGFCKGTCKVKEDCKHEASCVKNRGTGYRFCKCKSPFEGDFCELVKECRLLKFDNCKGENGTCVHSEEAKRAVCICDKKKQLDVSVTSCKDCYCGENGQCAITRGVKTCTCNKNYTEGSDGICHAECKSDSDCKNGGICTGNVCYCMNGTTGDDCGVIFGCDKLQCEYINAQCTFDILNKMPTCTCEGASRFYVNKKCMECYCGEHSTSCEFDRQGKKICQCKNGFSPRNGTCTDNTITDTKKELMVFSIQREFKLNEVFKFYGVPS